jgi:hypothetical protein
MGIKSGGGAGNDQRTSEMEKNGIGSQGPQQTVVLEENNKNKTTTGATTTTTTTTILNAP